MKVFDLALSLSTGRYASYYCNRMQIDGDYYRGCSLNSISKYDLLITFH